MLKFNLLATLIGSLLLCPPAIASTSTARPPHTGTIAKLTVTIVGAGLMGLELWWFLLSRSQRSSGDS